MGEDETIVLKALLHVVDTLLFLMTQKVVKILY